VKIVLHGILLFTPLLILFLFFLYPHIIQTPFPNVQEIILQKDGYPYYKVNLKEGPLFESIRKTSHLWGRRRLHFQQSPYHLYICTSDAVHRFDWQEDNTLYSYDPIYQVYPSSHLQELLQNQFRQLDAELAEKYGELLPWEEVKKIFPLMGYATVIDFDTRLSFRVQRRAGHDHADVQPLTREDTAVMKKIYKGRWSWERKAILVEINGRRIAASMHGMPHGAGAIQKNQFPGHFCIHFYNSLTHSHNMDPDHMRMVLRAAGKVE